MQVLQLLYSTKWNYLSNEVADGVLFILVPFDEIIGDKYIIDGGNWCHGQKNIIIIYGISHYIVLLYI